MNAIEILWQAGLKLAEISQRLYQNIGDLGILNTLGIALGTGITGWIGLLILRR